MNKRQWLLVFFVIFFGCVILLAKSRREIRGPSSHVEELKSCDQLYPYNPSVFDGDFENISKKNKDQISLQMSCILLQSVDDNPVKTENLNLKQQFGRALWLLAGKEINLFSTWDQKEKWVPYLTAQTEKLAGITYDVSCVPPGTPGYPTSEETFGLDYCPGDDVLLRFVGRQDLKFREIDAGCMLSKRFGVEQKSTSDCDVLLGTSAGIVGLRKFPNPNFNKAEWIKANGSLGSWENFAKNKSGLEPPFKFAVSCVACHGEAKNRNEFLSLANFDHMQMYLPLNQYKDHEYLKNYLKELNSFFVQKKN